MAFSSYGPSHGALACAAGGLKTQEESTFVESNQFGCADHPISLPRCARPHKGQVCDCWLTEFSCLSQADLPHPILHLSNSKPTTNESRTVNPDLLALRLVMTNKDLSVGGAGPGGCVVRENQLGVEVPESP